MSYSFDDTIAFGIDIRPGLYQLSYYKKSFAEPQMIVDRLDDSKSSFNSTAYVYTNPINGEKEVDFSYIEPIHESMTCERIISDIFYDDINDISLTRHTLIAMFIRHCFIMLSKEINTGRVNSICFTAKELSATLQGEIRLAIELLDMQDCTVTFSDYMESYYYYLIRQKKTAFAERSVVFYRYGDDIVMGSLVFRNRLLEQSVSGNEGASLSLPIGMTLQQKDKALSEFIDNRLRLMTTSSVFVSASDLLLNNMPLCLKALENKGHIYAGNNLFVQGAAYFSFFYEKNDISDNSSNTNYLGSDRIKHDIYIEARHNKRQENFILASAEQSFFDVNISIDVIAEDTKEFVFFARSMENGAVTSYKIPMNLPERPGNTTRLRLNISFANAREFMVEVLDLGFGGLYPTSSLCYREVFTLN